MGRFARSVVWFRFRPAGITTPTSMGTLVESPLATILASKISCPYQACRLTTLVAVPMIDFYGLEKCSLINVVKLACSSVSSK